METITTILTVIQVIIAIAVIAMILMQQAKSEGLSGALAGSSETFFGKSGRSIDKLLRKLTVIGAAVLAVISLIIMMIA